MSDLLTVDKLSVATAGTPLVQDISFTLGRGERVGLIGESGSGKSLTALSVLGLLPEGVHADGSIRLAGVEHDLVGAGERELGRIRGKQLTMVFQEPMTSLNPTQRVGNQVAEVLRIHSKIGRAQARKQAVALLERVRLPDPAQAAKAYPHQLSGGQRQRVVLAIALANRPAVLLCDEPTTALDVTVQAQMLALIEQAVVADGSALLFITHDLAVVATICERVLVMYGGRIVESGSVREVFRRPRHRYTAGLLAASDLTADDGRGRLPTIPGSVPGAGKFPAGCVFRNRCAAATDACAQLPPWTPTPSGGYACWHPEEVAS
jgi:peptide/nickel transport system ATP-binding protein